MTSNPSDAPETPLSLRLRLRAGPEVIGTILALGVILLVAGTVLLVPRPSEIAATAPSATAEPTEHPTPSAFVAPEPNPATPTLIAITDRLLIQRADLQAEWSREDPSVQVIARLLRDINASLLLQEAPLALLATDPATADIAAQLQATHDAAVEGIGRIQQASIRNGQAYLDGAAEVVAVLEPMVELRAELAALAGDQVSPAGTGRPIGSAAPTGSTH